MRCLGRLIGLILVALFIIILPLAMWTFNVQRIMLDGATYKRVFASENFYTDLVPRTLPALLKAFETGSPPPGQVTFLSLIEHTPSAQWETIAADLVPVNWVEAEVQDNLDAVLNWLDGDVDELHIPFYMEPLRRRLDSLAGESALVRMGEALPACSPDEELLFEQFVAGEAGATFPYCRPSGAENIAALGRIMNTARLEAIDLLPPQLDVIREMHAMEQDTTGTQNTGDVFSDEQLGRFRSSVRLWRGLLPLALMVPLAVLSLIVIAVVRSKKSFFGWIGSALLLGSLVTLLPLFLLPFAVSEAGYETSLEQGFATGGALIAEVVGARMIRLMISAFTWPVLIESAILVGTGFIFLVLSVLLNDPDAPADLLAAGSSATRQHVFGSTSTPTIPPGSTPSAPFRPPDQPGGPA